MRLGLSLSLGAHHRGLPSVVGLARFDSGLLRFDSSLRTWDEDADTVPSAFSFAPITDATPSTEYDSDIITVAGINAPAPVTVTGGTVSIDGGAQVSSGTVSLGGSVCARMSSSASWGALATATVDIGGVSADFEVTTADSPAALIPTLLPGAGWAGTGTVDTANIPAENTTPYGTTDDSVWANAQMRIGDMAVIESLTYIVAICTTAAEGGIDKVYAAFEDGDEEEVPWAEHPVTGKEDYIFAIGDSSHRNGLGRVRIRAVPFNGLERVFWKTLVLNANPSGTGYIALAERYVDPSKANDLGDGLSWATAKKTTYGAIQSFSSGAGGDCATKICRVNLAQGSIPWFELNGKPGGVSKVFTYRPQFVGQGRKDTATETKLDFRGMVKSPTDATASWTYRWLGTGPRPYFTNMLIDWAQVVIFYTGAYYEDFDEISDLGPTATLDSNGFPYGLHKSETGNNAITNANTWKEDWFLGGSYLPGERGRWGGERHIKANYTSTHYQPSTIQERWDGEELFSADCVFIGIEGDWLLDNVEQTQGIQLETRLHVENEITVSATPEANTPSAGKTRITFTGTFTEAMLNDPNNLFVRVIASAASIDPGDVEYPESPDGSRRVSTTGYLIDGSTGTLLALPFTSNKLVINDAGNRLSALQVGDTLRCYARYHGDSGQSDYDLGGQNRECRENITIRHRFGKYDSHQRYLVQIGALDTATTSFNGTTTPPVISGYTVSTSGRTATFDPGVPPALKRHCLFEPRSGLSTLQSRRVVRVLNSTQVYLDEPFAKDSDGTDYDLPAGTTFAAYRGLHGFVESGSMQHKSSTQAQIMQFQHGISGSAIIQTSLPGWTDTEQAVGIYVPTGAASWKRGGYDLRFVNTILHNVGPNVLGIDLPSDLQFINSHVEKALPAANATVIDTDTGYVFGYPTVTAPLAQDYVPSVGMTRTVATVYERRRRDGTAIVVGSRIGSEA